MIPALAVLAAALGLGGQTYGSLAAQAAAELKNKNYTAIKREDPEGQYYLGLSLLALERYPEAVNALL